MKNKISTLILGILLIGVVSAGLVTYLSNTIIGSVEVKGPVFYLEGNHKIGDDSWGLSINNQGLSHAPVYFTGDGSQNFISPKLNVSSFYPANWRITLYARTSNNVTGKIDANIYTLEGNNPYLTKQLICSSSINIPRLEDADYHEYVLNCNGDKINNIDEEDRIVLRLSDGFNSIRYYVELSGNSKIEIIPR